MTLGLFPLVGRVLPVIPTAVFGGAVMLMFGTAAVAGFNILRGVKLENRSLVTLAVWQAADLGMTFLPEALAHFSSTVRSVLKSGIATVLKSGIATGSICALVLNRVVPKPQEESPSALAEATPMEAQTPVETE